MSSASQVRAGVLMLWVLLAAGPLLGAAALLRTSGPQDAPSQGPAPAHVLGFAELVVASHLQPHETPPLLLPRVRARSSAPRPNPASDAAVHTDGDGMDPRHAAPVQVSAVGSEPAGPGRWGVTVVALHADGGPGAWQTTIADTADGPVAELIPAPVPLPAPLVAPARAPGAPVDEDDPRAVTVAGFVHAWYVGQQDLDRWASPSSPLVTSAAHPAPADDARVTSLISRPLHDGRQVALAEVLLTQAGVMRTAHVPLLLAHTGDRWEVARLLPALPLATANP